MESSPPIYDINSLNDFCMVKDFFGCYSKTNCNFNFNIDANGTVNSYRNSSFNFSFLHLLKCLLAFRIMKLKSARKITVQFEIIP